MENYDLASLEDVDRALLKLGELQRDIELVNADLTQRVEECKRSAATQAAPLQQEATAIEAALKTWGKENRGAFKVERSRELTHGVVGYRRTTKLSVAKNAVDLLRAAGRTDLVIETVKAGPDRERLKALPAAVLAAFGCKLKTTDAFYFATSSTQVGDTDE